VEIQYQTQVLHSRPDLAIGWYLVATCTFLSINLVLRSIVSGTHRGVTVTTRRLSRVGILSVELIV